MNVYASYTLDKALKSKGYDARKAEDLLMAKNGFFRIDFVNRGDGHRLAAPLPGTIQYIKATGGKWGRSSQTRYGPPLAGEVFTIALRAANLCEGL